MAKNSRTGYGFGIGSPLPALTPQPIISTRSPLTTDLGFELGSVWINTNTAEAWHLTRIAAGVATWALSSSGSSDLETLTGDTGGAVFPIAGNITLAGGTNITTNSLVPGSITYNLDAAITLATSITSPLYTAAAATNLIMASAANADINLKMGDNAGANKISYIDSDDAEQASLDSDGNLAVATTITCPILTTVALEDLTLKASTNENVRIWTGDVGGASSLVFADSLGSAKWTMNSLGAVDHQGDFTQRSGIVSISMDNSSNDVDIGGGNIGRVVNIGSSVAAHDVTIGSQTTGALLTLQAEAGITMNGTVKQINTEFSATTGTDLTLSQSPLMQTSGTSGGVPIGSPGSVNLMYLQDGVLMEQFIMGTQSIIAPRMSTIGLNIALDSAAVEGAEYNFGARNNAKHAYTIGTSAAFFMEAKIYVADISGCQPLMIGFRKVEANNALIADYSDYACIGLREVISTTNIIIIDELNGGGLVNTNTTDAWGGDGVAVTLKVLVSNTGVVTYTINGSVPSVTSAFTFDTPDVVMPFIHFLNGTDIADEVSLQTLKIGFQP